MTCGKKCDYCDNAAAHVECYQPEYCRDVAKEDYANQWNCKDCEKTCVSCFNDKFMED